MPVTSKDFSLEVAGRLYIDRWGISTLSEFNTVMFARFKNQSPQDIYVKAVLNDPNGNWTFDDGTTEKQLGSVQGYNEANYYVTLKRAVPSSDVEDEQFTLTFEIYKDSGYSTKIDQLVKSIKADIVDLHNPNGWTTSIDDFDDGTQQGWTFSLFSVSDTASVQAGGYSAYYYYGGSSTHKFPSLTKTVTVPSGVTKAGLVFYWGGVTNGYCPYHCFDPRILYIRVYLNGALMFEDYPNAGGGHLHKYGWYQASLDLTQYAGQDVEVKIEAEVKADNSSWIKLAIDDIILASK